MIIRFDYMHTVRQLKDYKCILKYENLFAIETFDIERFLQCLIII